MLGRLTFLMFLTSTRKKWRRKLLYFYACRCHSHAYFNRHCRYATRRLRLSPLLQFKHRGLLVSRGSSIIGACPFFVTRDLCGKQGESKQAWCILTDEYNSYISFGCVSCFSRTSRCVGTRYETRSSSSCIFEAKSIPLIRESIRAAHLCKQ